MISGCPWENALKTQTMVKKPDRTPEGSKNSIKKHIARRGILQKGLATGGLLVGVSAVSTSAAADNWDKRVDQTGNEIYNPCTGETMTTTSGTAFFDVGVRKDQAGGFHVNARVRGKLKLEGNDSGLKYESTGTFSKTLYVDSDSKPITFTVIGNLDFTSQGSAPNFRTQMRNKITVEANGDLTVYIDYDSVKCLG